jgi:hypothetical protein
MQNGLYVFDISQAIINSTNENVASSVSLDAFPNPFSTDFFVNIKLDAAQDVSYEIYDAQGNLVLADKQNLPAGPALLEIPAEALAPGMYLVKFSGKTVEGTSRLVKTN